MAAQLFLLPFRPALNANAIPVAGAKLYFYATGTTTHQAVYADSGLTTPLANPVEADASGAWPAIYMDGAKVYRIVMKDADGATLPNGDTDPYIPGVVDALAPSIATNAAVAIAAAASAESWAEGTLPGGAGTKSAKEWSEQSGLSATYAEAMTGPTYASTAAGLSATTSGQGFAVNTGDGIVTVYLNNAGVAVAQRSIGTTAYFSAPDGSSRVGFQQSGTGAIARTVQDRLRDAVNAKDFGAVGDGVATGEQVAINKALATNKDVEIGPGTYLLSDAIISTKPGQVIKGAGRHLTILKVPATFNLSAVGVIYSNGGEPGIDLRDLTIEFVQPDTATRASLTAYPPAIYAQGAARFRITGCRIIGARTGVDMRGNTGGAVISDLEISSFDYAVRIDGSLDTVRIDKLHHWPFSLTANQQSIFFDASNIGLESARCDDLKLTGSLFIGGGKQLRFISSGGGNTFGTVSDTQFDTWGAVEMTDGNVLMTNCSWSSGNASVRMLLHTGGNLRITSANFECAVALTNPMIECSMSSGGISYLAVVNSIFRVTGNTKAIRVAASSGSANAIVTGNQFVLPSNSSPTNPVVDVAAGGRVTFVGNRASDKGTGTGNLLAISQDNIHLVCDNAFLGWGLSMPASWSSVTLFNNNGVSQGDFISNRLVGRLIFARYTGTAGAGGSVAIPHGITAGQYKIVSAQAWAKGGSGEMQDCAIDYIDGTNIGVTGAGASAKVRVFVTYTETQDAW